MRNKFGRLLLMVSLIISIHLGANFAFAQNSDQAMQKAKEYFAAGRQFILQGNYAAANEEFKKAQALLGISLPLASAKAKTGATAVVPVVAKAKETAKAEEVAKDHISYYAEAIKLAPKNGDLYYNLALEYIKMSEYKKAAEELKRALQLNHRDKDACYNLGVLYENYLEDRIQAIYYYSHYIDLAPRADDVWRVRVWIRDLKMQIANEK